RSEGEDHRGGRRVRAEADRKHRQGPGPLPLHPVIPLRGRFQLPVPWFLFALVLLGGCAQVGPLTPPSAHLPRPPSDFAATRSGPAVSLRWTPPTQTSDGANWSGPTGYRLCVWPGVERGAPAQAAPKPLPTPPQIPSPPPPHAGADQTPSGRRLPTCPQWLVLDAPPPLQLPVASLGLTTPFATLALYAVNRQGDGAGWSNPVTVPLTPVAPPPRLATATPTADGVALRWTPPQPPPAAVKIYRNATLVATVAGAATSYLDPTAAWDQPYQYFLRSAAGTGDAAVESQPSNVLQVTPGDVFAPPAPTGLEAVAAPGGDAVDLSWNAPSARDLAGYNVYLQIGDGPWQQRNATLLPTPVFHDSLPAAPAGAALRYAVTALDSHGNQSPRSAPVRPH